MRRYENTNGKDICEEHVMTEAETGVWATSQGTPDATRSQKEANKKKKSLPTG